MKRSLLTIMCGVVLFTACSKNDDNDDTAVKPSQLSFKWRQDSIVMKSVVGGMPFNYALPNDVGDYVDFRLDGKAYSVTFGDADTSAYKFNTVTNILESDGTSGKVYFTGDKMRIDLDLIDGGDEIHSKSYFTKW